MRRTVWWTTGAGALMVLSVVGAATSFAAPLRGSVRLSGDGPSVEGENTYYWKAWNGFIDPRPTRADPARELAVVLTGSASTPPTGCRYELRNGDLYPRTLAVKAGARFRIENRDGCSHELHSESLAELTPLATAPGNARQITVAEAGTHALRDRLYPHVRGTIVALPDLVACARVRESGAFTFRDVEPGEYQLKIYRGEEVVHERTVTLDDGRQTLDDPIAIGGE